MAFYEHVLISRADMSAQQVETLTGNVTAIIEENGGRVQKTEYWGLRTLAYPIKKAQKAHYALLGIELPPEGVTELERRVRINEDVLRFLTVRVEALSDEPSPVLARKDRERSDRRFSNDHENEGDAPPARRQMAAGADREEQD